MRSYCFETMNALPEEVRRVACSELDSALEQLEGAAETFDSSIHNCRKSLKKLRALLRLVRQELGEDIYRQENRYFRDLGRALSAMRDAAVHGRVLDQTLTSAGLPVEEFSRLRQAFSQRHHEQGQSALHQVTLEQVEQSLRLARERVARWPLHTAGFKLLSPGLHRSYADGQKCMLQAYAKPSPEAFHDFRKRVKDHFYQLRLIRNLWPAPFDARIEAARYLSELLGDDHDLAGLQSALEEFSARVEPRQLESLQTAILERSRELRALAYPLGQCLYAEKPKALTRRFRRYYESGLAHP